MAKITVSIQSSSESHRGEITVDPKKERYAFLRLMAMIQCAESGVYQIDSLEGVPEALQNAIEEMRRQRDIAIEEKSAAIRESDIAKMNTGTEQIARLNQQILLERSEFDRRLAQQNAEIQRLTTLATMRQVPQIAQQVPQNRPQTLGNSQTLGQLLDNTVTAAPGTKMRGSALEIDS